MTGKTNLRRWIFWGYLGSFRFFEVKLETICREYPEDKELRAEALEIKNKLDKLRELMMKHRDDWKATKE